MRGVNTGALCGEMNVTSRLRHHLSTRTQTSCHESQHHNVTLLHNDPPNPKRFRVAAPAQALPICSTPHLRRSDVPRCWERIPGRAYAAAHRLGKPSASGTGGTEAIYNRGVEEGKPARVSRSPDVV
jgi:hypothetical protein